MWVEFIVGSLLCYERFSSGYSGFPLSSKNNISKFPFDQESGRRRTALWMCYLQIIIHLFICSLIIPMGDLWPYRQGMVSLRCPRFTIFLVMNKKNFCPKIRLISLSQEKNQDEECIPHFVWWLLWYLIVAGEVWRKRVFSRESYFIKAIENVFRVCIAWYKNKGSWENRDSYANPRRSRGFA